MNLGYEEYEKMKIYWPLFFYHIADFQKKYDIKDPTMLFMHAKLFADSAAVSNFSRDQFQDCLGVVETLFEKAKKDLSDAFQELNGN